ncbi:MAG: IS3 family transposase, partial [Xanthobacteraceae bacterium]
MKPMKTSTTIAFAAAALLAGVTAASAASMQPRASDTLDLNATQQKMAWNDLDQASNQKAPAGFAAAAGAVVPKTVKISAVPSKAARDISSLRPFDFAKVQGKLLIVNPSDRKVERFWRTLDDDVIEGTTFDNLDHFANELFEYIIYYNNHR